LGSIHYALGFPLLGVYTPKQGIIILEDVLPDGGFPNKLTLGFWYGYVPISGYTKISGYTPSRGIPRSLSTHKYRGIPPYRAMPRSRGMPRYRGIHRYRGMPRYPCMLRYRSTHLISGVCPYIGVYPSILECTPTHWGIPVYGNALQYIGVAQYTYGHAFNTSNKSIEIT
jgi:hypothetical protein